MGRVIGIFTFRSQHGQQGRARRNGQDGLAPLRFTAGHQTGQCAHRRKQGRGKAQTYNGPGPQEHGQSVAQDAAQHCQPDGPAHTGKTRQQGQKKRAEGHIAPEMAQVGVQGQSRGQAVELSVNTHHHIVQHTGIEPWLRRRQKTRCGPPAHAQAVPDDQRQKKKGRQAAVGMHGQRGQSRGRASALGIEIRHFLERRLFQQRRHIDVFPSLKHAQHMRYAAGAEHKSPVAPLGIVGQTGRAGNIAPEGRQAARLAPDGPTASGMKTEWGGGVCGH